MAGIFNFLKRFAPGDPVKRFCSASHHNRVANILEDVQGVGCRILKPTDREGRGWRVVVDGSSDVTLPNGFPTIASMGFPYGNKLPWTYTIAGAVVSVHNGRFDRYPGHVDATNPTDVTFTAEGDFWIGYLWETQSNMLTITGPLSAEPYSGDAGHTDDVAEGRYRGALYKFMVTVDDEDAVNSVIMARDYIHGRVDLQVTT